MSSKSTELSKLSCLSAKNSSRMACTSACRAPAARMQAAQQYSASLQYMHRFSGTLAAPHAEHATPCVLPSPSAARTKPPSTFWILFWLAGRRSQMVSSCALSVQLGSGTRCTSAKPASRAAKKDGSAVSPCHSPTTQMQDPLHATLGVMVHENLDRVRILTQTCADEISHTQNDFQLFPFQLSLQL